MEKKLVSMHELAQWLTDELRKVEDCSECSINSVLRLKNPDENGCNWSVDPIIINSCDISAEYVRPHLQKILARARKMFNLID